MAGYAVISEVSRLLVETLRDGFDPGSPEEVLVDRERVGLASPDDAGNLLSLTLYLYRISENSHMKNRERLEVDGTRYKRPPLALDLYYLLTAHSAPAGDNDQDQVDPHLLLGRGMQILHDDTVLEEVGDDEEVYVSIYPQSMDEMANIWNTFQDESFQPSVSYLVSPVIIDSAREETTEKRVVERQIGKPGSPGVEDE